ncbi:Putative multidrug resistance efflux transporter [Priestia flexa]|jgi:drug/metabolite transporter (DMT)-like permease|nr:Putative multidrug resistance efflux transporter [Priestia flexa]
MRYIGFTIYLHYYVLHTGVRELKPIILGVCSAFFFAFTFVLNRMMEVEGGSWIWSASLRFFFMVPLLLIIVIARKKLSATFAEMKKAPMQWVMWSTIGFGLFYAPLCYASAYGPSWLIAGTWQITIISGSLLAPLFYETIQTSKGPIQVKGKIPFKSLAMALIILLGVAIMQIEHATTLSLVSVLLCTLPILVASFAYPLGNRKMMVVVSNRLDAYQRVLGMTIASLPFWIILAIYGLITAGPPSTSQVIQSGWVALFSGVIATVLFFAATNMVKGDMKKLGAVEATQSLEVLFALLGEMILLGMPLPTYVSCIGIVLVIAGMALNSYVSSRKGNKETKEEMKQATTL